MRERKGSESWWNCARGIGGRISTSELLFRKRSKKVSLLFFCRERKEVK